MPPPSLAPAFAPHRITILLVDDHALFRAGLRTMLNSEPGFRVVGDVPDGEEAIDLVVALAPDVVVTDLVLPHMSGFELARRLGEMGKRSPHVVAMSSYATGTSIRQAIIAGACVYVSKLRAVEDLITPVCRLTPADNAL